MIMIEVGFENLHVHSDFSLLDGFAQVEEYAERASKNNQKYLCVTDHGMMGVIPRQIRAAEATGLTPLFGVELYVQDKHVNKDDIPQLSDAERREMRKSYHLLAIAYNNKGYRNLVALTSWGWLHGFYYKPRVTHEQLLKHKEGIIFTSCCYNGEIGQAFEKRGEEAAEEMLRLYKSMFGDDFRLELMFLDFQKQKPFDAWLIKMHCKYHIPLIVSCDCHYCGPQDSKYQRYMLMVQTGKTKQDLALSTESSLEDKSINAFELQDTNLWYKNEQEIDQKWITDYKDIVPYELLLSAKENTVSICEKAKNVTIDRSVKLPSLPDADERLKLQIKKGVAKRGLKGQMKYLGRIKEEYELICRKGFASYFLIQQQIIDEARRICPQMLGWGRGDEAVGPGRGSAAASLVCYVLGITDIDPIRHNLLFSRFLNESRGGRNMKIRFSKAA
jgi:DNA polymerase-3 subunit alpha